MRALKGNRNDFMHCCQLIGMNSLGRTDERSVRAYEGSDALQVSYKVIHCFIRETDTLAGLNGNSMNNEVSVLEGDLGVRGGSDVVW